ncbi:MAG: O-antigen ligase family protein [bacterium]
MNSRIDYIILFGLLFLLIFAPLAYGANHVWSYTLMEIMTLCLVYLWLLKYNFQDSDSGHEKEPQLGIIKTPFNYFLLGFIGIAFFQLLPIPVSLIQLLFPATFRTYSKALDHLNGFRTVSLYSHVTVVELLKWLTYAGIFWLTLHWAEDKSRIQWIVATIVGVGFFQAVYGMLQYLSGHQHIWGYRKMWYTEYVTGTYINRNHLAGYLEMAIPLAFGLLIYLILHPRSERQTRPIHRIRDILIHFDRSDPYRSRRYFLVFVIVMMTLALLLSGSRGGIISLTIAFILMNGLLIFKRKVRSCAVISLLISCLVLIYGIYIGMGSTVRRFESMENDAVSRIRLFKASISVISEFPVLGTGLGTFEQAFRRAQSSELDRVVDHAHNDWIEMWVETGGIGLILLICTAIWCMIHFAGVWWKRHDSFSLGIGLGGMGGVLSLSLHGLTDFNMHIPANALTFAVVLAITLVVLHLRKDRSNCREVSDLPRYRWDQDNLEPGHGMMNENHRESGTLQNDPNILPKKPDDIEGSMKGFMMGFIAKTFVYLFLMFFFVFALTYIMRPYLAERQMPTLPNSVIKQRGKGMETDQDVLLKKAVRAIHWNQRNAEYFYRLTRIVMECSERGDYSILAQNRNLLSSLFHFCISDTDIKIYDRVVQGALKKAIDLNPVNPLYHYTLGFHYMEVSEKLRKKRDDRWCSPLSQADLEFERAFAFSPNSPKLLYDIANYWLWKAGVVTDQHARKDALKKGSDYFNRLMRFDGSYRKKINQVIKTHVDQFSR